MVFDYSQYLREDIRANLSRLPRNALPVGDLRQAAVAVVLVADEETNQACFVLTRRSSEMRRHRGQYALPGGRLDADEDAESAALREIDEEIGIALDGESVLGWLDDFVTRSGFRITPLVVWAGAGCELQADPNEVEAVFRIPLWDLNRPEVPRLQVVEDGGRPVLSAPLETLGHEIYAPTAAILYQFREVGLHGRTIRVAHFEQPKFAWK